MMFWKTNFSLRNLKLALKFLLRVKSGNYTNTMQIHTSNFVISNRHLDIGKDKNVIEQIFSH